MKLNETTGYICLLGCIYSNTNAQRVGHRTRQVMNILKVLGIIDFTMLLANPKCNFDATDMFDATEQAFD